MKRLWSKYRDRRFFAGAFTSTPICIVDEQAKVEDKQYCRQTLNSRTIRKLVKGFSFVELQVALVILAMGLLSFAGLFRIYSLQTSYIEQSSLPVSTYYIVSQSNRWMQQLGVPADMEQTAGQSAWTPPVSGDKAYRIRLNQLSKDFDNSLADANVTLEDVNE